MRPESIIGRINSTSFNPNFPQVVGSLEELINPDTRRRSYVAVLTNTACPAVVTVVLKPNCIIPSAVIIRGSDSYVRTIKPKTNTSIQEAAAIQENLQALQHVLG